MSRDPIVKSGREPLTPAQLQALLPKLRAMRIIRRGDEARVRIDPQGGLTILSDGVRACTN
jgi:hypothetical protein